MSPGIYPGISNEVYQAGPGLSVSGVKAFRRTPYHFRRQRAPGAPQRPQNAGMRNGTLVHCALLEPDQFALRYADALPLSKNSTAYKLWAEETQA